MISRYFGHAIFNSITTRIQSKGLPDCRPPAHEVRVYLLVIHSFIHSFETIQNHSKPFEIIRHHLKSFDIIRHHSTSFDIIRHHSTSFDIIKNHQKIIRKSFKTTQNNLLLTITLHSIVNNILDDRDILLSNLLHHTHNQHPHLHMSL